MKQVSSEKEKRRTREAFTAEEDEELRRLVSIYGEKKWNIISRHMTKRNPKQCCERWLNYLTPTVVNAAWTAEEDEKLRRFVNSIGNRWATIKNLFPGRSEFNLRNRWTVLNHAASEIKCNSQNSLNSFNFTSFNSGRMINLKINGTTCGSSSLNGAHSCKRSQNLDLNFGDEISLDGFEEFLMETESLD
ncbi:DNA-binding protein eta2 [Tritrichomonas foetus]|uniref:DNA-binding protein eta2 n=1 Tax=Tritrichomonas foetus TaxID=1144522 RepID=A0A1J4KPD1_9EUKA|nr:DNA-binding protein eta2 [Tritrichomonas foetus]|eukprot:OHT12962.1 DNA-binding protein eta2 [Tritrichomonas foetus]